MNTLKLIGIRGGGRICAVSALMLSCARAARASVFDDAKFKLDLRGDANSNNYIDVGEVGNAFDFSAASPDSVVYGGGNGKSSISASQYASYGYDKYGTLPYIADRAIVNPYDGSDGTTKCLVLPQSMKTDGSDTYWAWNGIALPNSAVPLGEDGSLTIYTRFFWEGNTTSPNLLIGNGWDGAWSSTDHGIQVTLNASGKVGILNAANNPLSSVTVLAGVWYDLFVVTRNTTINGSPKAVSDVYLYKANSGLSPTLATGSITHTQVIFASSKRRLTIGSYLLNSTGWLKRGSGNTNSPRSFKGAIAEAIIWDRALTDAEMFEVMAGPAALGGDWQIGAVNGSANEFNDATPADVYDVQTMPWNKMRKSLTAENPSLTLSTMMTADDHKRNRTLTFTPILSGVTSAPVEVSLNGTVVGEIDLATTTSITLPRKLWRHGSGLANTIVVTRKAPVAGTVQFDAISLAEGDFGEAGGVLEDATFKLDLRGGESDYEKPGDLGNALDYSSSAPLVGYMGDQRGPQTYNENFGNLPAQETADVQNPYYPYTTNTQTVLHFYQDQKSDTTSVRSSVVIPGAAPQGKVQTFYVRFRWDGKAPASTDNPSYVFQSGNAVNGYQTTGVAMYINQTSVSADLTTTNACIGYRGSNSADSLDDLKIKAGDWNDVFVTFSQNAGNTAYTVTETLCKPVASGDSNFSPPSLVTRAATVNKALSFDTGNLTLGGYHDSAGGATPTRAFRGLIADFMIWERALTDEEKIEIMAGQHGSKWTIGAANGSADEFTDDNPAEVFEPLSMEWKRMRKTLTAASPTLTIKSPLAEYEAGKPVILSVTPILDGTGAEVPVTVLVNGAAAGTLDLAKEHSLIIDRQHWTRDENGNVTVAITRTDTTGSVAIDAITLSGSWQNAAEDGGSNGMLNQPYSPSHAFAGDTDVKHFTSAVSVGASHTNYTFGVWVPEGMGEKCGWKFRTATTSPVNDQTGLDEQHTLYVNGTVVGTHDGKFGTYEPFTLDIPAGTLHDGMNYVQWVQTLPTRADQQALDGKPGIFQFYDYWGMTLVPPSKGLMIIIR